MIKNDFNDGLADEFFTSLKKIENYDLENKQKKLDELFKEYLNFNSNFLSMLSVEQLNKIFVHPRIKDYSKLSLLGILFIKEWSNSNSDNNYYKLLKGFEILKDIYINNYDTSLKYFIDYLINACDELCTFEIDSKTKYEIIEVYYKHLDLTKLDNLCFELVHDDIKYKNNILNIYNNLLSLDDTILSSKSLPREEINSSINDIENFKY